MSQLLLTRSAHTNRFRREPQYTSKFFPIQFGSVFLIFAMTILIGVLSFFYLVKFTEVHTKGYQLRKLEIEKDHLLTARESKNTEISQLKTLNSILSSNAANRLVPVNTIVFVKEQTPIVHLPSNL